MRTEKDKQAYRVYRLAGGLLDLCAEREKVKKAREQAAEQACAGIGSEQVKELLVYAIEENLKDQQKDGFEMLARRCGLPFSRNEFGRRKKIYAEILVEKVSATVGKNRGTM